ncbi:MAG: xanthine dehydrogenase family protein molybdopterin-binding subunit [Desulfotignum sp.]|nr:xanthine dehydrogenase family protein molybdopterin-binding subunit [Desulfotignum sp.]
MTKDRQNHQVYVGQSVIRHGGRGLVTGRTVFAEDTQPLDMLVLKALRSEKCHADILGIEAAAARKVPGVAAVFTAADIPGKNRYGVIVKDQPLLAHDKIRFAGEAVALVAAEDEAAADEALAAIDVHYRDLAPVMDPETALAPETALVHEQGNLLNRKTVRKGDVEKGFRQSDIIVEHTYHTQLAEHSYLEPDAGTGTIDEHGVFTLRVCTQNPHYDRKDLASLLGIDEAKIRIIQTATGGGFGSKLDLTVQGFIALALFHLQCPVKMLFSREEVFLATSKRHPARITLKTGVQQNGRIMALKARILFDTGAYSSYGTPIAMRAAIHITGPYNVEHVDVESTSVYTNNPVAGAMRGVAIVQTTFACESQMDVMAQKLGIDPLEFRRINAMTAGSITATGQQLHSSVGILKTLDALPSAYAEALAWKRKKTPAHIRRGIGLGSMWYGIGSMSVKNPSHATIHVDAAGHITLCTGASDIGQGSTTTLCQIIREILGVEPGMVRMITADTGQTLDAGPTSASRQTYVSGNAVLHAAQSMARDLLEAAPLYCDRPGDGLCLKDSCIKDASGRCLMVISELLEKMVKSRGPLEWEGYFDPLTTALDPETGHGVPFATYTFASHLALVEVDIQTGKVHVHKVTGAQDVGRAINPQGVLGQIHGGVGMGLGYALMEDFLPGRTLSMSEYHIPTSLDLPTIQAIIIEDPEPTGPFGAKGMGEPSLAPTAPAVVNAITDAIGKRIYRLPADPEAVRRAVRNIHTNQKEP